jgi:hypothetical protein
MGVSFPLGQGPVDEEILGRERGHTAMWKSVIPLSEVLRMVDLIKEISIDKYSQEEYREIVNQLMTMTVETKQEDLFL